LRLVLPGSAAAATFLGWVVLHRRNGELPDDPDDWERRVRFVCCDGHGDYSPGVYMRVGGGHAAFATVREAAPFMRAGDPGSAAAGLCGFLFRRFQYDGETTGTLALDPPPEPGPDGVIDWNRYGGDGDIILINVDKGTAKCCFGSMVGQEVHNLPLGGQKIKPP
jgi:hypothetical protein